MVGDGTWLKLSEVIGRLSRFPGYHKDRIRDLADAGYLRSVRPPVTGRGYAHRRFETKSVELLEAALALPQDEQAAALEALKARNAAPSKPTDTDDSAPTLGGEQGQEPVD